MPHAAAIYCRISQDPDGTMLGVERQREDCLAMAERRGWPVAQVFIDNDASAYSGKPRPQYRRMLAAIKNRDIDGVVVWHLDRLHRNPAELEEFFAIVDAARVRDLATVTGDVDLGTEDGRFHARIMGAVSRKESADKSRRIKRKHEQIAKQGQPIKGGTRAFGLTSDWTAIVPAEADLIREAARRVLAGDSIRSICADWGRRGVTGPERRKRGADGTKYVLPGTPWAPSPMRRMLTQPRLAGLRTHLGTIVGEGTWPAIIDRDSLDRLRAILLDPARRKSPAKGVARRYLLTGVLRCAVCGSVLVARPRGDGVRRYVCAKGPGLPGCGGIAILADPLEADMVTLLGKAIDSPETLEAIRADLAATDDDQAALDAIRRDEASLEQLAKDHYALRLIDRAEYLAARDALTAQIADARRTVTVATRDGALAAAIANASNWSTLDFDQRRAILTTVLDHVVITPARRGLNRYDPTRITEPVWRF